MTCEQFSYLLDEYLQGKLHDQQMNKMNDHLNICDDCKLLLAIRKDCQQLDESSFVPSSFSSSWRQAIREQERSEMSPNAFPKRSGLFNTNLKRWFAAAASLVFVIGGTWLVSETLNKKTDQSQIYTAYDLNSDQGSMSDDYERAVNPPQQFTADTAAVPEAVMSKIENQAISDISNRQKIIRSISFSLVTRTFDEDIVKLNDALKGVGGYVEYSNITGERGSRRYAVMTLRVPKNKLDNYLREVKSFGRVTSVTESQEDVSEQYSDTETRLLTQTTKLTRLQELLKQANLVEDILTIEREIADTQYQVDALTGFLRGLDSRVDYSIVQLSLQEETPIDEPADLKLGQRINLAVSDAWKVTNEWLRNLIVLFAVILPYILVLLILAVIFKNIFWRKKK